MSTFLKKISAFISWIFSSLWFLVKAFLISVGLFFTAIFATFAYLAIQGQSHNFEISNWTKPKAVNVAEIAILEIVLEGKIVRRNHQGTENKISHFFNPEKTFDLDELRSTLLFAAKDEKVKALFIEIKQLHSDFSSLAEVRRILNNFRESSSKPISIHVDSLDTRNFYLASVADTLNVPEYGDINISGPSFQMLYFASAFEKLGMKFEVVKSGQFKSAFEPFIENAPSTASVEMYDSLNKAMYRTLSTAIASNKRANSEQASDWLKKGWFLPSEALKLNMINSSLASEDLRALLLSQHKQAKYVKYSTYKKYADQNLEVPKNMSLDAIALLDLEGEVAMDAPEYDPELITPRRVIRQIEWIKSEKNIKAVVVRINSPGGSALASELIWQQISRLAKEKPVIASLGDVAASGGYYIAAPATKIIAEASTYTGSIGVIGMLPKFPGFSEKWGINFHYLSQDLHPSLNDPVQNTNETDFAVIQKIVDHTYMTFKQRVADGRKLSLEQVEKIAQGRVWLGEQALEIKLIDQIGGLNDAIQTAKLVSGLNVNQKYPLLTFQKPIDIRDCFSHSVDFFSCIQEIEEEEETSSFQVGLSQIINGSLGGLRSLVEKNMTKETPLIVKEIKKLERLTQQDKTLAYWMQHQSVALQK
ncbi:MAG: signal peptide peptidase SppA [Oligoflexales bacterium]|nr:signal peptide peptidase SppA [Oligoflexales bacterium]